jgi:hypothetical protein
MGKTLPVKSTAGAGSAGRQLVLTSLINRHCLPLGRRSFEVVHHPLGRVNLD